MEVRKHEKIREQKNNLGGVDKQAVFREKEWYREKIVDMVEKIENQRFLKAIYISISDYLKENEPD